jgi:predicted nucleotidyltransferase
MRAWACWRDGRRRGGRYNRRVDHQALGALARRHGIALVIRFGSTVTGHTHPGSDVDLGVLFERFPTSLDEELQVIADLQALDPTRPVDVAVLNRADPLLLKQVTDHARLEYGTEARFDAFRRYAFKRYQDHRPYFDLERQYVEQMTSRRG